MFRQNRTEKRMNVLVVPIVLAAFAALVWIVLHMDRD